jgi:putative nucleotidyltransferase with HDIG domain
MRDLFYRLRQFGQAVAAEPLAEAALAEVKAVLSAAEFDLFRRFDLGEQQHSFQVMGTLKEAGYEHPALLTAALLHDVGKTRSPLSVWDRSLVVAAEQVAPERTAVWGQGSAQGWQRPFVVKARHPAWGAEMAEAAGSSPLVVSLIRRHQDDLPETAVAKTGASDEEDDLLRLLQWADDQN